MMDVPEKTADETAREYINRVLLHNITNLNLPPGVQLQEAELCAQLQVGRTPLREAILELAQIKIIEIYPQRGTYVSLIDSKIVEEVRYLRYLLESDLAALACDKMGADTIEKLRENIQLQKYYNRKNVNKLLQLDRDFHYEIYQSCDKLFLYEMVKKISIHFDRSRKLSFVTEKPELIIEDHEKIIDAVEKEDKSTAERVMKIHLSRSLDDMPNLKAKYPDYFTN